MNTYPKTAPEDIEELETVTAKKTDRRKRKRQPKMKVSGKQVFQLQASLKKGRSHKK
ncbi:MAG: hypothetical protein V1838_04160 [Patescibacteria group bacterium]